MNRPDISRLNRNRSIFLKLGFIFSLAIIITGFSYTIPDYDQELYHAPQAVEEDELVDVRRTIHPKRKTPPRKVAPAEQNIVEDLEYIEVPEPTPLESTVIIPTEPAPLPDPDLYIAPPRDEPTIVEVAEPDVEEIFVYAEQMPRFAGCEDADLSDQKRKTCADQKLLEYIYNNIKYPPLARENSIEGTVVATFVVEKDGSISMPEVLRDIGGGCGREIIRILRQMPDWIPGEQRGRKVRVQFNLPVKFTLQ